MVASAEEYIDPLNNVIYTYDPASNRAEVKPGTWLMFDNGEASLPTPGSPDAKDEIGILDRFSVEGKEYVVDKIGDYAFSTLINIKSVVIPSSVKSIGMCAFFGCVSLSDLFLSEGLISIGVNAFCACHSLTNLLLPEGLETIGSESFELCSKLKSVSIPSSVTSIGLYAFLSCSALTDVYCYAETVPETSRNDIFKETPISSATLHVPAGSIEKYKAAAPWSEFGNIVAIEPPVTFTRGQVATIILPITPDASKGRYFRLDRMEDGKIIFEEELHPQARTPYVIVPNEDFSIDPGTLDLAGLSPDTVSIEGISFIGSYSREELNKQEGWYIDIIDTTPDCQAKEGKVYTIGALRAYLTVNWDDPYNPGGTRSPQEKMEIVLNDKGTGLVSPLGETEEGVIYDLQGRRISGSPARGIYIKDGRKVLQR